MLERFCEDYHGFAGLRACGEVEKVPTPPHCSALLTPTPTRQVRVGNRDEEELVDEIEAEAWAAHRAAHAKQKASLQSRQSILGEHKDQGKKAQTWASMKQADFEETNNRFTSKTKHVKQRPHSHASHPQYPSATPANAYAIPASRADAIMASLNSTHQEMHDGELPDLSEELMIEMQKESSMTKEQREKMWSDRLKKEFKKAEKTARHLAAPTDIPQKIVGHRGSGPYVGAEVPDLHAYLENAPRTGEGWPRADLGYEDDTQVDHAIIAKVNLTSLVDGQKWQQHVVQPKQRLREPLSAGSPPTSRSYLGSSKTVTPPSSMKSVAKGLASDMWHREEEEEKEKIQTWKDQNKAKMQAFESNKASTLARVRELEMELGANSDSD